MAAHTAKDDSSRQMGEKKDFKGPGAEKVYPSGLKFIMLIVSAFTAMFLVSLDKMIITTAIPHITDEFQSKADVGWYGTAYLLTNCAFQLVFGKLYKFLPVKTMFLTSLLLFEAGSAICGAAPNSIALIFGRVIAGLGAGGILPGVMMIIVYAIPLHKRPKYQGFFGALFGVASLLGPTVGGAFTTHVTWRWCFYINLPIGIPVMVLIFFLLDVPDQPGTQLSLQDRLRQANILGFICLVPGIICLCLLLQYGGTTYAWSDRRIIALFVVAFVLLIAFVLVQVWLPDQAILPPRIPTQRSIASGFWVSMCVGAHQTIFLYYLPIWFQAIQGKQAVESGIDLLPMVLVTAAAAIGNGQLVSFIGYYTPSLLIGVCLTAIGAGLLTTFGVDTSEGKWIGYQILYGFGLGLASQAPNMAAQTVLPKQDVAIGASLMFFAQTLFGAIFVSVGQNVLDNQLTDRLQGIPGMNPDINKSTGATDILDNIDTKYRASAFEAYNNALRVVFQVALCMACLALPGALALEWRSVKKNGPPKKADVNHAEKGQENGGEGKMPAQRVEEGLQQAKSAGGADESQFVDRDAAVVTPSSKASHVATQSEKENSLESRGVEDAIHDTDMKKTG
ncbi:Major facilitator superfamily domain, general substrate transporter [Metarhizium rileyi]|uniref:Major facilitator superfamily domain, general substrate transporter n=1 Tax=Metarhizium rileyi (strain RCEF 4871) TaxID=1649241 RepID=A0A166Z0B8_METRR|nr:Major facilitator superfamily domain, general substrate transporter [Metarhizium rileyi RCEF 4871]